MSVRLSAAGEKARLCLCNSASRKAVDRRMSMAHSVCRSLTAAAAGLLSGWNDQNVFLVVGDGRRATPTPAGPFWPLARSRRGLSQSASQRAACLCLRAAFRQRPDAEPANFPWLCRRQPPARCRLPWPSAGPAAGRGCPLSPLPRRGTESSGPSKSGRTCCSNVSGCTAVARVSQRRTLQAQQ